MTIHDLQERLTRFAEARDWQQFHNPKNLAMALAAETGELLEIFQWLTPEQSAAVMRNPETAAAVRGELADVFAYLLQLAAVLQVDLESALVKKITLNESRYPVDRVRGSAAKYTRLTGGEPVTD